MCNKSCESCPQKTDWQQLDNELGELNNGEDTLATVDDSSMATRTKLEQVATATETIVCDTTMTDYCSRLGYFSVAVQRVTHEVTAG